MGRQKMCVPAVGMVGQVFLWIALDLQTKGDNIKKDFEGTEWESIA
jgi:hypothetical protein